MCVSYYEIVLKLIKFSYYLFNRLVFFLIFYYFLICCRCNSTNTKVSFIVYSDLQQWGRVGVWPWSTGKSGNLFRLKRDRQCPRDSSVWHSYHSWHWPSKGCCHHCTRCGRKYSKLCIPVHGKRYNQSNTLELCMFVSCFVLSLKINMSVFCPTFIWSFINMSVFCPTFIWSFINMLVFCPIFVWSFINILVFCPIFVWSFINMLVFCPIFVWSFINMLVFCPNIVWSSICHFSAQHSISNKWPPFLTIA